jgi:hypothetical protein
LKVIDWITVFRRKFSVDMAGFAINIQHLFNFPNVEFGATPGYLESKFLQDLNCTLDNLETKAQDCQKVTKFYNAQIRLILLAISFSS